MDALVLERFVLLRERQADGGTIDREAYLSQFELD